MTISLEISYYPLHGDDFTEHIKDFINRLNSYSDIGVLTNGMSTQVFGEFSQVMQTVTSEMETSFRNPYSVFVMKVVNADLRVYAR